jgi:tRNA modification GTPase
MLAIVGLPNVGKSSLFNRLVERERAIVTATPGTTRDLVTERVSIGGIPVNLVDTAGLREAFDEAEAIGVQKSREALAEADIVLLVIEAPPKKMAIERELLAELEGRKVLIALNKIDLVLAAAPRRLPGEPLVATASGEPIDFDLDILRGAIPVSATTGVGIDRLRRAVLDLAQGPGAADDQSGMLTNLRQHQAVSEAIRSLEAAAQSTAQRIPHEMVMLDLYGALRSLDALTGQTTPDDILNQIFSSFCIGK